MKKDLREMAGISTNAIDGFRVLNSIRGTPIIYFKKLGRGEYIDEKRYDFVGRSI